MNALTFADKSVAGSTSYVYVVTAAGSSGESTQSNSVAATTPAPPPPSAPTLAASAVSPTEVDLSWGAVSGATGYTLYRCAGSTCSSATGTQVATGLSGTSFPDTGRSASSAYAYVLTATGGGGSSADSNVATATTPAAGKVISLRGSKTSSGRTASAAITWPAATQTGDFALMVLAVSGASSPSDPSPPSGWTEVQTAVQSNTRFSLYRAVAPASIANATVTITMAASRGWVMQMRVYANGVAGASAQNSSSTATTTLVAPSVTTVSAGDIVVPFYAQRTVANGTANAATFTAPSGFANEVDVADPDTSSGTVNTSLGGADKVWGSTGPTGTLTATSTQNATYIAMSYAIGVAP